MMYAVIAKTKRIQVFATYNDYQNAKNHKDDLQERIRKNAKYAKAEDVVIITLPEPED